MRISKPGKCRLSECGFTLVELLVVLAVIASVAVVASLNVSSLAAGWALRNSAYSLQRMIAEAHRQAIRDGEAVTLRWDDGSWSALTASGAKLQPADARLTVSFIPAFLAGESMLELFPDGTSTGGTFRLAMSGQSIDVGTHWLTGVSTVAWP